MLARTSPLRVPGSERPEADLSPFDRRTEAVTSSCRPREGSLMKRRECITLIVGAAAVWSSAGLAQQQITLAVGFMSGRSEEDSRGLVAAFRQGLGEAGFVEGQNVI